MTRTVRINRDRLRASTLVASRHDAGLVAKGTDGLVNAVLRLADQP
jgi:hypothetical protein